MTSSARSASRASAALWNRSAGRRASAAGDEGVDRGRDAVAERADGGRGLGQLAAQHRRRGWCRRTAARRRASRTRRSRGCRDRCARRRPSRRRAARARDRRARRSSPPCCRQCRARRPTSSASTRPNPRHRDPAPTEQDVLGPEIAVAHVAAVGVDQRVEQIAGDSPGASSIGSCRSLGQPVAERRALHRQRGEVDHAVHDAALADRHDARLVQRGHPLQRRRAPDSAARARRAAGLST